MEFDWLNAPADFEDIGIRDIEESFEDPFGLRLLPDLGEGHAEARYFILGKSVAGRGIFTVFWTDGKRYRVIQSRLMTETENGFYDRKNVNVSG